MVVPIFLFFYITDNIRITDKVQNCFFCNTLVIYVKHTKCLTMKKMYAFWQKKTVVTTLIFWATLFDKLVTEAWLSLCINFITIHLTRKVFGSIILCYAQLRKLINQINQRFFFIISQLLITFKLANNVSKLISSNSIEKFSSTKFLKYNVIHFKPPRRRLSIGMEYTLYH